MILVLAVLGCDASHPSMPAGCPDNDRDGFCWADDCDDARPESHPGAPEIWYDGLDEACDGGDDFDQDGDGYPAVDEPFWTEDLDCDDTDPAVQPGALRICGNGKDDDCDGADDCSLLGSVDLLDAAVAAAVDLNGAWIQGSADLDGDGAPDWVLSNSFIHTWILRGVASGTLRAGDAWATLPGTPPQFFGDLDGDGVEDGVVSEDPLFSYGAPIRAYEHLAHGTDADAEITVSDDWASVSIGDLDGDGVGDLVLGSTPDISVPLADGTVTSGVVDVFAGPVDGTMTNADATAEILASTGFERLGDAVEAGPDLDGDGLADLVACATPIEEGAVRSVLLYPGPVSGDLSAADGIVIDLPASDLSENHPIHDLGDADGDGRDDLGVSGDSDGYGHATWIVGGEAAPSLGFPILGVLEWSTGWARALGDVDGDGFTDLGFVGNEDAPNVLFYSPFVGTRDLGHDPALALVGNGIVTPMPAGDVDGDGLDDLLVNDSAGVWGGNPVPALLVLGVQSGW